MPRIDMSKLEWQFIKFLLPNKIRGVKRVDAHNGDVVMIDGTSVRVHHTAETLKKTTHFDVRGVHEADYYYLAGDCPQSPRRHKNTCTCKRRRPAAAFPSDPG